MCLDGQVAVARELGHDGQDVERAHSAAGAAAPPSAPSARRRLKAHAPARCLTLSAPSYKSQMSFISATLATGFHTRTALHLAVPFDFSFFATSNFRTAFMASGAATSTSARGSRVASATCTLTGRIDFFF